MPLLRSFDLLTSVLQICRADGAYRLFRPPRLPTFPLTSPPGCCFLCATNDENRVDQYAGKAGRPWRHFHVAAHLSSLAPRFKRLKQQEDFPKPAVAKAIAGFVFMDVPCRVAGRNETKGNYESDN